MGLKADHWIRKMAKEFKMIEPFCEANVGKGVVMEFQAMVMI